MDESLRPDTMPERNIETQALSTGQFNSDIYDKVSSTQNTYVSNEHQLVLYFPQQKEPVIIASSETITLGRFDPSAGDNPTIDLTPYNAELLGVSRFHAVISLVNGIFHIKDMGSTNGTRINEKKIPAYRLIPFHNGDTLRFGHLNVIVG